jgi:hypothetical protein
MAQSIGVAQSVLRPGLDDQIDLGMAQQNSATHISARRVFRCLCRDPRTLQHIALAQSNAHRRNPAAALCHAYLQLRMVSPASLVEGVIVRL